ncbi:MAG: response regulator transcription factor [Lachnospiraceae bacterium]|nr:response regulator transcription factor [Lachnospiraceae bacterium]
MYKILIADDEEGVVSLLKDYLELNQYETLLAYDGPEAVIQSKLNPDLILLDINMPGMDGLSVCRQIRDYVNCPIIFLTARIEDADKIKGFAAGGDDYIVKPFSVDELGARIAAHIRREHRIARQGNVRYFGKLAIDYTAMTVAVDGSGIDFPKKEFEILELLSIHAGQVFDKERIYELVWGYDAQGDSGVVAEHVRRIRSRLRAVEEEYHLETVWGLGYRWVG